MLEADTPFKFYEKLKESQIFHFLKLVGCSNEHVGEFSKFVKRRNRIAHPSGTVLFNDQASIDAELSGMMKEVQNIQRHMKPVVLELYGRFLEDSSDVDTREYASPEQELEANFIHRCYISQQDLDVCVNFDLSRLVHLPSFEDIKSLHQAMRGFHILVSL